MYSCRHFGCWGLLLVFLSVPHWAQGQNTIHKEDLFVELSYNQVTWDPLSGSDLEFGTERETQHIRLAGLHNFWNAVFASIGLSFKELSWFPAFSNEIKYEFQNYDEANQNTTNPLNTSAADDAQDQNISTEGSPYVSSVTLYNELTDLIEAMLNTGETLVPYTLFVQDIMVGEVEPTRDVIFTTPEGTPLQVEPGTKIFLKIAFEQDEAGVVFKIGGLFDAQIWAFDVQYGQFTAAYSKPSELPTDLGPENAKGLNGTLIGLPEIKIEGYSQAARLAFDLESWVLFLYYKTEIGTGEFDVGDEGDVDTDLDYYSRHVDATLSYKIFESFHLAYNNTQVRRTIKENTGFQNFLSEYTDDIQFHNLMIRWFW